MEEYKVISERTDIHTAEAEMFEHSFYKNGREIRKEIYDLDKLELPEEELFLINVAKTNERGLKERSEIKSIEIKLS